MCPIFLVFFFKSSVIYFPIILLPWQQNDIPLMTLHIHFRDTSHLFIHSFIWYSFDLTSNYSSHSIPMSTILNLSAILNPPSAILNPPSCCHLLPTTIILIKHRLFTDLFTDIFTRSRRTLYSPFPSSLGAAVTIVTIQWEMDDSMGDQFAWGISYWPLAIGNDHADRESIVEWV